MKRKKTTGGWRRLQILGDVQKESELCRLIIHLHFQTSFNAPLICSYKATVKSLHPSNHSRQLIGFCSSIIQHFAALAKIHFWSWKNQPKKEKRGKTEKKLRMYEKHLDSKKACLESSGATSK